MGIKLKVVIVLMLWVISVDASSTPRFSEEEPTDYLAWAYRWAIDAPEILLKQDDEQLVLSGKNPGKKMRIANEIRRWLDARVENFYDVDWNMDVNVTDMIKPKFQNLGIGRELPMDGINCHGTSLYVSDMLPRLSYVGINEMNYYLNTYCDSVSSPEPDAVGVVERRGPRNHSFKIIGPDVIFQKKSVEKDDPLKFYVISDYRTSEFFRCDRKPKELCPDKYVDLKKSVDKVDGFFSRLLQYGNGVSQRDGARKEVDSLILEVQLAIYNEITYCQQDLQRLKYRLESLSAL